MGLTDLVKRRAGRDSALREQDFAVADFRAKIETHRPAVVAFNGKKAAEIFLGHAVGYGFQPERIVDTRMCVLPSTSGAARSYWDEEQWIDLARFLKQT